MTEARLRLARTEGVGPITYRRLLRRFRTAEAALDALPVLAREAGRMQPPSIPTRNAIRREMDGLERMGAHLVFQDDATYPPLLARLEAAPPVIAVAGDPAVLSEHAVAVVGARNASINGQRLAELMGTDLGLAGLVTVSGLARGIDTAAHEGAMRTGRTVACVAGGLDVPYPPENADLQRRVAENGAVVAEAPLGTPPQARHFPRRNRVIAGLALGVVVVEAAPKSGSLITARYAAEAGRELFAVPGSPLDPRCRGSNDLIRSAGAHLTESAADVIANLPAYGIGGPEPVNGIAERQVPYEDLETVGLKLAELLGPSWSLVDDLVRRCHFSPSAILGALELLEAEGAIQRSGNQVCRIL